MNRYSSAPMAPLSTAVVITVLFLSSLAILVDCDTPVHCEYEQIIGNWELLVSQHIPYSASGGIKDNQHLVQSECKLDYLFKPQFSVNVELRPPNKVVAFEQGKSTNGTFTMVYDQAFELVLNGYRVCKAIEVFILGCSF